MRTILVGLRDDFAIRGDPKPVSGHDVLSCNNNRVTVDQTQTNIWYHFEQDRIPSA